MSTGSIKHNIVIDSVEQAERFLDALERAEQFTEKECRPKVYIVGERINLEREEPTVSKERLQQIRDELEELIGGKYHS